MALSDSQVDKQITQMMAFIDQEANEKVEEIEQKAEEEFNLEKGRLVQQERVKIKEHFDKKEKQVELQKKIQNSNLQNQSRLSILKAREDNIHKLLDKAKDELQSISQDASRYSEIVEGLVAQALCKLLESKVTIQCRQKDVDLVKSVSDKAAEKYKELTGDDIRIDINQNDFLPEDSPGGVIVTADKGKLKCVNTLEARLEMVSEQMLPETREMLYGANENRKFLD